MQWSKINTHSSKCMILLECLTLSLVPESSPTPSHLPKPRMRILIFICLLVDNPAMCRYQLDRLRRLILFMDYPPIYQLGRLRRLIFLILDNPQIIHILDNPENNFSSATWMHSKSRVVKLPENLLSQIGQLENHYSSSIPKTTICVDGPTLVTCT